MIVSEAVMSRFSCRSFLTTKVPQAVIHEILDVSRRAPSGGNLQPWHVYVLQDDVLAQLIAKVREGRVNSPRGEGTEYCIYPTDLKDPYDSRRDKCGEDLYATIGVKRSNTRGRVRQFRRNFEMFGATTGLFVYIDRTLGPPQWADVGMFLQTIMLVAREQGLHTCPQEAWATWHKTVGEHLAAPEHLMLFCGIALGYVDPDAPINTLVTERADMDDFVTWVGKSRRP